MTSEAKAAALADLAAAHVAFKEAVRGIVRAGRGRGLGGPAGYRHELVEFVHYPCISMPKDFCNAWSVRCSSGATSVSAVPVASARPVRPTRCTYISRFTGTS